MISRVCVVIPAADEERRVAGCLTTVLAAADAAPTMVGRRVIVDVIVTLDGCRDGTAAVVAGFQRVVSTAVDAKSVGVARATGADVALQRVDGSTDPSAVLLASTDADSSVPRDWLAHLISRADAGADLVLGTVRPGAGLPPELRRRWRSGHRLQDGHPHVHGANLAIRASTLTAAGGWGQMGSGEDVDLATRVEVLGATICRTGGGAVQTSARPTGRAPQGFSSYLRALGRPQQLSHGERALGGIDLGGVLGDGAGPGVTARDVLAQEGEQRAIERLGLVEMGEMAGVRKEFDPAVREFAARGLQM